MSDLSKDTKATIGVESAKFAGSGIAFAIQEHREKQEIIDKEQAQMAEFQRARGKSLLDYNEELKSFGLDQDKLNEQFRHNDALLEHDAIMTESSAHLDNVNDLIYQAKQGYKMHGMRQKNDDVNRQIRNNAINGNFEHAVNSKKDFFAAGLPKEKQPQQGLR